MHGLLEKKSHRTNKAPTFLVFFFLLKGQHKSPNKSNFEVKRKHNILKETSQAQIYPFQYEQNSSY